MMANEKEKKENGAKILNNFKKQISNHPALRETLNESKKGSALMGGLDPKGVKKNKYWILLILDYYFHSRDHFSYSK